MSLIYITGVSGSGKSTVQKALQKLGFDAYDVDDRDISGAYDLKTGEVVDMPVAEERTPDWFSEHSWRILPGAVEKLKATADNNLVFLCGAAENDKDFVRLFDSIICLDIDESTLRHRIAARQDNDYGKNEHELRQILDWHKTATEDYKKLGATVVDASQPLEKVIDTILDFSKE